MAIKIPEYDTFKVSPNVLPAANINVNVANDPSTLGARQMVQAGEQIQRGGEEFAAINLDAAQQGNQLRVDDSLNKLKEQLLSARFDPNTGFEYVKGIDALERPSGKSLTQDYTDIVRQRADLIEGNLANDAQKRAFRMNANNMLTAFGSEAEQHEGREFQSYALSVRDGTIKNRMNEIGLNYNNPEAVDAAVNSIAAATYSQGQMLGKSAEWIEAQTREAVSKAHGVAIKTALQKNDITYANQYMQKYSDQMNADDILSVNGQVTKEMDNQVGLQTANQIMQTASGKISTSDSDRAFNIALGTESNYRQFEKDGVTPLTSKAGAIGIAQVMPETAKEVAANNGIEWDDSKYKTDAAYNQKLGKLYFDKQLKDFNGNLAMAYAAYNAGPGRLQDAIKAAKKAEEPTNWVAYLPLETRNYVSKNMNAYGSGAGNYERPSLMELQNQAREQMGTQNPTRLKTALDEISRQYSTMTAAIKQQKEQAVSSAMQYLEQNGGSFTDLPPNLRGAIAPEDITKVMDFGKRIAQGDDTSSLYLYQELTSDPSKLKALTDDQFYALRSELSNADFKHFAQERGKLISGTVPNGPGDLNTAGITRSVNTRLSSMGIVPNDKDNNEQVGSIYKFVNQAILIEQQNRAKKMNDSEVDSFIDQLFMQRVTTSGWFFDSKKPLITAKVGDIPSATKDALKSALKRKGIDDPSDEELLNAYRLQSSIMEKAKAKPKNGE